VMQFEGDKIKHMQKIWHSGLAMKELGWVWVYSATGSGSGFRAACGFLGRCGTTLGGGVWVWPILSGNRTGSSRSPPRTLIWI